MAEPLLDIPIILELLALSVELEQNIYGDIVSRFKSELPACLSTMHAAIESGDFASLQFQAHALKGQASMMGAQSIALACDELELAAQNRSNIGLKMMLTAISESALATMPVLDAFLKEYARTAA